LDATGCVLPKPREVMALAGTPCSARKSTQNRRAVRKTLMRIVAADAVRVAFDLQCQAWMGEDDSENFCQLFAAAARSV